MQPPSEVGPRHPDVRRQLPHLLEPTHPHLIARDLRRSFGRAFLRGRSVTSTRWSSSLQPEPGPIVRDSPRPPFQPAGNEPTHGTAEAVGTACAIRIMRSSVPHTGSLAIDSSTGVNNEYTAGNTRDAPTASPSTNRMRRGPHRCREMGWRCGARARNWATRSRPSRFITLRSSVGLAMPTDRGERLGDLIRGEQGERPPVDALGVGAHRQDQHHVGEIDRLPPRRRTNLREGDVDARGDDRRAREGWRA